jgi:hypothetical protein
LKQSNYDLLSNIKQQNLYLDKLSVDPATDQPNPKYKLAGNSILDHYFFHILTTRKDACKLVCTLEICLSEWENKIPNHGLAPIGYCDLRGIDLIRQKVLLSKIKNPYNGFPYIARLSNNKYQEFQKLIEKAYKLPWITSETKEMLKDGFKSIVKKMASELNLK